MKKTLRFFMASLLLMLCGSMSAGTITFGELNLENGVQYTEPFDGGDFTVTFAGGANDGKYYNTGAGIRVYGNGTMTIAAKQGNLTEIAITYGDGSNYRPESADVVDGGTYNVETGVWTGSAQTVVFTRPSGSGHWRVAKIEATVSTAGEVKPAKPTFSPNGGTFFGSVEVSLAHTAEAAAIRYSVDDGETWQNYAAPFTLTETTTVRAYATVDGKNSDTATATFTAGPEAAGIGAFNELASGTEAKLNFQDNVQVVFTYTKANGTDYVILQDDNKNRIELYNMGAAEVVKANDVLTGYIVGKNSPYRNLPEMAKTNNTDLTTITATAGTAIKADVLSSVAAAADPLKVLKLCQIKGVTVEEREGKLYAVDGAGELQLYDTFGIGYELPELEEGQTLNITGIVIIFGDIYEFAPISQEAIEVVQPAVYKAFDDTYCLLTTVANINAIREEGWVEGGTTQANKNGTIDPATDEEGSKIVTEGVMLKNGNGSKMFQTRVQGVEKVWAYGCTAGGSDRDLVVTATAEDGSVVTQRATSSSYTSVRVEVELDPAKKYTINYTGTNAGEDGGSDLVLHGVKFFPKSVSNAIQAVDNRQAAGEAVYNLRGQRVEQAQKGIFIIGGKKVVK